MTARRSLLLIVVLALFVRVWPIDHGMPRRYVPDHHVIKRALSMAIERDLVPPMSAEMSYPYLVPYLLLPTFAAEYALGRASGAWSGSGEFAQRATEDPAFVHVPARAWMALFGALTSWAVYRAARAAKLGVGALAAAMASATCLLNIQISTHERPWAATIFFGALAAWKTVEFSVDGRRRELVLAGCAAALAFACHPSGLAFLALPAFAWLLAPRAWRGAELKRRVIDGFACVATFVVVALLAGHAYYLRYGAPSDSQVIGGGRHDFVVPIGGQGVRFDVSFDAVARLSISLFGYDPVLVVLGLAGLAFALRVRALVPTMLAMLVIAGAALVNPSDHVRYLLPACMLLTLPAGVLVERMWSRRAGRVVALALFAVPLVQALRFDWVLRREDTRAEAERVLAALAPEAVIAVDNYGPQVELSRAALERVGKLRELYAREALRAKYFEAGLEPPTGAGVNAIQCEDLFGVDAQSLVYGVNENPAVRALGTTPSEVLAALGVTHLVLAERRRSDARPLAALVANSVPLAVVDPSADGERSAEAFLPTEMDFPLTGLWSVDRPGPRLEVHALRR